MKFELNFLFLLTFCYLFVNTITSRETCQKPYNNCNSGKPDHINVHVISHSHDDLGWLKTVDQYYYGPKYSSLEPTVKQVLDSVVQELLVNPTRKFVYAEIGFFWMWWNEQNNETKQLVRSLVDEGRFEFVMGSWSMNDEATTYYRDIIDQQALGFKFILNEFGSCARPRAAWQIDPFGHSREQASLFSQFGFDGLFLGRVDYQDFKARSESKSLEMLWQGSESLGKDAQIFTGILPNLYLPPTGFCWETTCQDDQIMDDPNADGNNVNEKVNEFLNLTRFQSLEYKTNNLIMTFGSDFHYSNARRWFDNLDKLIFYVNQRQRDRSNVNIFYSTPACYLHALNQENIKWPMKYDDFFPYADQAYKFWTGFYTSRPALKYNVRQAGSYLHAVKQLAALGNLASNLNSNAIGTLERAMGVLQHHDAVSGTERQHVANDYARQLSIGVENCITSINDSYSMILKKNFNVDIKAPLYYCSLLNITECLAIENQEKFDVIIYNQLARRVKSWISLPVVGLNYQVVDLKTGQLISSDNAPVYEETALILERKARSNYRLIFDADLPPLGFKVFGVEKNKLLNENFVYPIHIPKGRFTVKNDIIALNFDSNGNLDGIKNLASSISAKIRQNFCYYGAMSNNNMRPEYQSAGAYVFRPNDTAPICFDVREYSILNFKKLTEVHQLFNNWLSQTIRLYKDSKNVEFEWQVGPIDINDKYGKDVIMKFESDLKSNSKFYTDSNGREILLRVRNSRPTWSLNQTEPIAGNYYPVNSRIFIRDEITNERTVSNKKTRQFTFLNDRSQGGSSIYDGSVEIMLHRRLLSDDSCGLDEVLNETVSKKQGLVVKGVTFMLFETIEKSARLHRDLAHRINNKPIVTFSFGKKENNFKHLSDWSALAVELPSNLHLLTFAKDSNNSIIVRIEHFYEKHEDKNLSNSVTINLKTLFSKIFNFVGVEELSLGTNMKVDELNDRMKWKSDNQFDNDFDQRSETKFRQGNYTDFNFKFNPMQIRTFRLYF